MKKRIMTCVLIATMVFAFNACSDTDKNTNTDIEVSDESGDAEIESNEAEKGTTNLSHEEQELELIKEYFDVEAYMEADGKIEENKLDVVLDEAQVGDEILKIGMSYDEVINAGFTPVDDQFPMTETGALAYRSEFQDKDGMYVTLGFIGSEGGTVADGELYSITVNYMEGNESDPSISVGEINNQKTLSEVISILGDPGRIDTGVYSELLDMSLEYDCKDRSLYLKVYADLETEEILVITLEGYAE